MADKKIRVVIQKKKKNVEIDESVFNNLSNLQQIDTKMQEYSHIYNQSLIKICNRVQQTQFSKILGGNTLEDNILQFHEQQSDHIKKLDRKINYLMNNSGQSQMKNSNNMKTPKNNQTQSKFKNMQNNNKHQRVQSADNPNFFNSNSKIKSKIQISKVQSNQVSRRNSITSQTTTYSKNGVKNNNSSLFFKSPNNFLGSPQSQSKVLNSTSNKKSKMGTQFSSKQQQQQQNLFQQQGDLSPIKSNTSLSNKNNKNSLISIQQSSLNRQQSQMSIDQMGASSPKVRQIQRQFSQQSINLQQGSQLKLHSAQSQLYLTQNDDFEDLEENQKEVSQNAVNLFISFIKDLLNTYTGDHYSKSQAVGNKHLLKLCQDFNIDIFKLKKITDKNEREMQLMDMIDQGINQSLNNFIVKQEKREQQEINLKKKQQKKQEEESKQDCSDIYYWLNIQTKFNTLKNKMKVEVVSQLNKYHNFQKTHEFTTFQKIYVEKYLKKYPTHTEKQAQKHFLKQFMLDIEIPSHDEVRQEIEIGKNLMHVRNKKLQSIHTEQLTTIDFIKGKSQSVHQKKIDQNNSLDNNNLIKQENVMDIGEWNIEKEKVYQAYKKKIRKDFIQDYDEKSCNIIGLLPIMRQQDVQDSDVKLRQKLIFQNEEEGKIFNQQELEFLANTSELLNKQLDKKQFQFSVKALNPEILHKLELQISDKIIQKYEDLKTNLLEARYTYIKDNVKQRKQQQNVYQKQDKIKQKINMGNRNKLVQHVRLRQKLENMIMKEQFKLENKQDSDIDSELDNKERQGNKRDAYVNAFANNLLEQLDRQKKEDESKKQYSPKAKTKMPKKNFLQRNAQNHKQRNMIELPNGKNITFEEIRRNFHPSSKLIMGLNELEKVYDEEFFTQDVKNRLEEIAKQSKQQQIYCQKIRKIDNEENDQKYVKFYSNGPQNTREYKTIKYTDYQSLKDPGIQQKEAWITKDIEIQACILIQKHARRLIAMKKYKQKKQQINYKLKKDTSESVNKMLHSKQMLDWIHKSINKLKKEQSQSKFKKSKTEQQVQAGYTQKQRQSVKSFLSVSQEDNKSIQGEKRNSIISQISRSNEKKTSNLFQKNSNQKQQQNNGFFRTGTNPKVTFKQKTVEELSSESEGDFDIKDEESIKGQEIKQEDNSQQDISVQENLQDKEKKTSFSGVKLSYLEKVRRSQYNSMSRSSIQNKEQEQFNYQAYQLQKKKEEAELTKEFLYGQIQKENEYQPLQKSPGMKNISIIHVEPSIQEQQNSKKSIIEMKQRERCFSNFSNNSFSQMSNSAQSQKKNSYFGMEENLFVRNQKKNKTQLSNFGTLKSEEDLLNNSNQHQMENSQNYQSEQDSKYQSELASTAMKSPQVDKEQLYSKAYDTIQNIELKRKNERLRKQKKEAKKKVSDEQLIKYFKMQDDKKGKTNQMKLKGFSKQQIDLMSQEEKIKMFFADTQLQERDQKKSLTTDKKKYSVFNQDSNQFLQIQNTKPLSLKEEMEKQKEKERRRGHQMVQKKLQKAARDGNLYRAKNTGIVLQPIDVNTKDEFGNVPLYYVTKRYDKDFVNYLLNEGADVNIRCEGGNTPLHMIFATSDYDSIMKFMNKDGDLNILNAKGETPLCQASKSILKKLDLEKGLVKLQVDNFDYDKIDQMNLQFDNNKLWHQNPLNYINYEKQSQESQALNYQLGYIKENKDQVSQQHDTYNIPIVKSFQTPQQKEKIEQESKNYLLNKQKELEKLKKKNN